MKWPGLPSLFTKSFKLLPPALIARLKVSLIADANIDALGLDSFPAGISG
jgi:hypothetical protein